MKLKVTLFAVALAGVGLCNASDLRTGIIPMQNAEDVQVVAECPLSERLAASKRIAKRAGADIQIGDKPITSCLGENEKYVRSGNAYYAYGGGLAPYEAVAHASHIKFGYYGEAYIYQPVSCYDTRTYLVGYQDGEGLHPDIVCPMPQPILDYENSTGVTHYFLDVCFVKKDPEKGLTYYIETDVTEARFKWMGDHYELLDESTEEYDYMGLVMLDSEDAFGGFIDYNINYTPFKDKEIKAPADLAPVAWEFKADDDGEGYKYIFEVKVVQDEKYIYVQGIGDRYLPNAWIRADIIEEDGKKYVEFKQQYMGEDGGDYVYFCPMNLVMDGDPQKPGQWAWVLADTLRVPYDEENDYISCDFYTGFSINVGKTRFYYRQYYQGPELSALVETNDESDKIPHDPQFTKYTTFTGDGMDPTCGVKYLLYRSNVNGHVINTDNLYYNVVVDGDVFTFYKDEYLRLTEDITDIPFWFQDCEEGYDICIDPQNQNQRVLYFYAYDMGDIGLVVFYQDPETGQRYYSNVVYKSGKVEAFNGGGGNNDDPNHNGVDGVNADNQVVSSQLFDLSGRKVVEPAEGLYIRRSILENGNVKVEKIMKK